MNQVLLFSMTPYWEEIRRGVEASHPGAPVKVLHKDNLIGQGMGSVYRALRAEKDYGSLILALNSCAYVNRKLFLEWFIRLAARAPVQVRDKDGGAYALTYARLLFTTFPRLIMEAVLGAAAVLGMRRAVSQDAALAPFPTHTATHTVAPGRVGYLRTSSWFGVKAGGSVGHTTGVVNGFLELGYPIKVLSSDRLEGLSEDKHGLQVIAHSPWVNLFIPVTAFAYTFRFYREAYRILRGYRPRFLYQRYSMGNLSGILLARKLGVPLILEYNGSEVWMLKNWEKKMPFMELLEKAEICNLKMASRVVVVSDASRKELLDRGLPAANIVTVPNGVDVEIYRNTLGAAEKTAMRRRLGIPEDAIIAGFIGTFGKWHGVEFLAEAIKPVLAKTARKVHFLLIGDGPLMASVRKILARDGVGSHATLTGLIPQKEGPAYLDLCDLFLSPHVPNPDGSPFFGSPTKLFEYMAMGKGILASNLEQIGDILTPGLAGAKLRTVRSPADLDGELAVLHAPGDQDAFAAGLAFLLELPEVAAALGENARKAAHQKYTWKSHVENILLGGRA